MKNGWSGSIFRFGDISLALLILDKLTVSGILVNIMKKSSTNTGFRIILTSLSALLVGGAIYFGATGEHKVMTVSFLSGMAFLLCGHLDRISKFKVSLIKGIEAETRQVIEKAEVTIDQLRSLSTILSAIAVSTVKRSGRIGGFDVHEEQAIFDEVQGILKNLDISPSEQEAVFRDRYRYELYDYLQMIFESAGLNSVVDPEKESTKESLLTAALDLELNPSQVRSFIANHAEANTDLSELLDDLEYYQKNKVHRRLESWKNRSVW